MSELPGNVALYLCGHCMYHHFNIQQLYVYILPTQWIYVFCVDLRADSDYFMIVIPFYFLYQQISLWILCLMQLFIYYGQLHVSANICICEFWQTKLIFYVKLYLYYYSLIQLPDDSPNRGRNMQPSHNKYSTFQTENCNADCCRRRYPIQVQYSPKPGFTFHFLVSTPNALSLPSLQFALCKFHGFLPKLTKKLPPNSNVPDRTKFRRNAAL